MRSVVALVGHKEGHEKATCVGDNKWEALPWYDYGYVAFSPTLARHDAGGNDQP